MHFIIVLQEKMCLHFRIDNVVDEKERHVAFCVRRRMYGTNQIKFQNVYPTAERPLLNILLHMLLL